MTGRGVSIRFGCFLVAAGLSLHAQYTAETTSGVRDDRAVFGESMISPSNRSMSQMEMVTRSPLPDTSRTTPPGLDSTVSIRRLQHNIPGNALKEYERGVKESEKAEWAGAIAHFKRATEMDPEFVEAYNDWGAAYAKQDEVDKAISAFERAVAADPTYSQGFYNLAIMFMWKDQLPDAERAARRAVDCDRTSSSAALALGMALVFQDKFTDEAAGTLRKAIADYPQSHLFLARVLAGQGDLDAARSEVKQFLATGTKTGRDLAEIWLKKLQ